MDLQLLENLIVVQEHLYIIQSLNTIIMTNVDLVKKAYSSFATGNVEAVLAVFDPAIVWHECKGMPFVKGDGIFKGHEAIVKNVFMNLPVYFDGFNIEVNQIFGADDKVVMVGYYQGTNKATGHPFKANATHVWTVKKGKMTHFFQAVDTVAIVS
jgi:ketosteroid isomerase-like protein